MSKRLYYRAAVGLSAAGTFGTLCWAATGAPWALWLAAGGVASAFGCLIGGYIEPQEE